MLEDVEAGEDAKIVSWMPSGNAFKVHDTQAFAQKIIPKWFKQKCYKSFLRQLHLYGFQRVSDGPERGKTTNIVGVGLSSVVADVFRVCPCRFAARLHFREIAT